MTPLKQKLFAIVGAVFLLIGLIFIILPGPAILFIPLGLALLSFEYPVAKRWLRKYQTYSSVAARKTDALVARMRAR